MTIYQCPYCGSREWSKSWPKDEAWYGRLKCKSCECVIFKTKAIVVEEHRLPVEQPAQPNTPPAS